DGRVDRRKDDAREVGTGVFRSIGLEDHLRDVRGQRRVETPRAGFGVGFAGRAVAGGEPGNVEPGVVREELDESLSDRTGRAKNTYVTPFHNLSRIAQEAGSREWGIGSSNG